MYPYDIIPGIDFYTIFLGIAIVSAIVVFRICADKMKLNAKIQNFCIFTAVAAIGIGYFSAIFFQALYNIEKYGKFQINSETGATFYGGLIGGTLSFIFVYFVIGRIWFKDIKVHLKNFFSVANIAAAAIAIAHSFGRFGCLMAGCCHGKITDAWYGIYMHTVGAKAVPTQLFEALFLILLFAIFIWRIFNGKCCNLPIYLSAYGIWRFVIEYFRDDYRGTTVVDFMTPSQFIALIMTLGAILLFFIEKRVSSRLEEKAGNTDELG